MSNSQIQHEPRQNSAFEKRSASFGFEAKLEAKAHRSLLPRVSEKRPCEKRPENCVSKHGTWYGI